MRGTDERIIAGAGSGRFIPARAGNRAAQPGSRSPCPVHPRSCGEQGRGASEGRLVGGSSPLVRGTVHVGVTVIHNVRFIPARAGNSSAARYCATSQPVHPRSCGEQPSTARTSAANAGSSPLVRGTGEFKEAQRTLGRFIPARAGNRIDRRTADFREPVHPRSCGEQRAEPSVTRSITGSSPLVRGTAIWAGRSGPCRRFIPGRAGNRRAALTCPAPWPVHPRSCGEQITGWPARRSGGGSSPLVRGTG